MNDQKRLQRGPLGIFVIATISSLRTKRPAGSQRYGGSVARRWLSGVTAGPNGGRAKAPSPTTASVC